MILCLASLRFLYIIRIFIIFTNASSKSMLTPTNIEVQLTYSFIKASNCLLFLIYFLQFSSQQISPNELNPVIWKPPSLCELTLNQITFSLTHLGSEAFIFNMELTHLSSEACNSPLHYLSVILTVNSQNFSSKITCIFIIYLLLFI